MDNHYDQQDTTAQKTHQYIFISKHPIASQPNYLKNHATHQNHYYHQKQIYVYNSTTCHPTTTMKPNHNVNTYYTFHHVQTTSNLPILHHCYYLQNQITNLQATTNAKIFEHMLCGLPNHFSNAQTKYFYIQNNDQYYR